MLIHLFIHKSWTHEPAIFSFGFWPGQLKAHFIQLEMGKNNKSVIFVHQCCTTMYGLIRCLLLVYCRRRVAKEEKLAVSVHQWQGCVRRTSRWVSNTSLARQRGGSCFIVARCQRATDGVLSWLRIQQMDNALERSWAEETQTGSIE